MILEPWKSPEEIDRRLAALNDPELAELLRSASLELLDDHCETYAAPSAPYWKKRIGLVALAGLIAMSAGYAGSVSTARHSRTALKPVAALPARHRAKRAAYPALPPQHHTAQAQRAPAIVYHRSAFAPVRAVPAAAPAETAIRQERAQVLHERAIAAQAQAETQRVQHQAKLAMQAQAQANQQALEAALARARAQARAEALAKAQAEAVGRAQDTAAVQDQLLQNATDSNIKPGDTAPPSVGGRISTIPSPNSPNPNPAPGPVDTNCTPHRGSLFSTVLNQVRVGGTTAGGLLRLIHNP